MTSKGQITIPIEIRERLGLRTGQVLDFDPDAPFLKAVPVFDEGEMRGVLGCAQGSIKKGTADWLNETRGEADLPRRVR